MKRSLLLLLVILFLLSACSSQSHDTVNETSPQESGDYVETTEASAPSADVGVIDPNRMIELTYDYRFETKDYMRSYDHLMTLIEEHDAYVADSFVDIQPAREKNLHTGQFTIKVPKDNVQPFVSGLQENVGTMLSQSSQTIDHTAEYQDNATRLSSERKKLEALNALYARAETMEDIMAIQSQIIDTQTRIDQLEGSQKAIESRVDYTTIHLNLVEVFEVSEAQSQDPSFGARVMFAIKDSLRSFVDGAQSVVIALIYLLPPLIILMVLVLIGRMIWNKYKETYPTRPKRWTRVKTDENKKKDD